MDERVGGVYIEVSAEQDKAEPKKTISKLRAQAAKERPIEVEVKLDKNGRARDQFGRFLKGANSQSVDLPVTAKGISGVAARLAALSRERVATIRVSLDGGSASSAGAMLKSLTGGNLLQNSTRGFSSLFKNLDTASLKVAQLGTAFGSLGAVGVSSIGNILTSVSALTSIAGAGLALPGIMSGFAVGILGSLDGLQNINVYMREATANASALGAAWTDSVGNIRTDSYDIAKELTSARLEGGQNFWSEASSSLLALRDNFFVPFFAEYRGMMTNLGSWWGNFFDGVSSGLQQVGGMAALFAPLNEAIKIASAGAQPFAESMIKLGLVGGTYLPRMAESFTSLANGFNAWVTEGIKSGSIFEIIDNGIASIKLLAGIVVQFVSIWSAMSSAAAEAGSGGLQTVFNALLAINKLVSGGAFREALITVFAGANQAIANLLPGVTALKDGFITLSPVIAQVMGLATTALSGFLEGIVKAVTNPVFQTGIVSVFEAIARASQTLQPTFEVLGTKFGEFGSLMAVIIDTVAPLVNQLTTGLAPAFSTLMEGLQVLVPVLGQGLSTALSFLIPIISQVVTWVGQFVGQFPGLSAGIMIGVAAFAGLGGAISAVMTFLSPVTLMFGKLIAAMGGASGIFGTVMGWLGKLAGVGARILPWIMRLAPLLTGLPGLILVAVVAITALVIANWDTIVQWTTNAWNSVVSWTTTAWGNVLSFITGVVDSVVSWVQTAWSGLVAIVTGIWEGITGAITGVLTGIWDALVAWVTSVITFWTNAWALVSTAVSVAFGLVMEVLTPIFAGITAMFSAFIGFIVTAWTSFWGLLVTIVTGIWEVIVAIVQGAFAILVAIFQGIVATIVGVWTILWNSLVSFMSPILATILSIVTTIFGAVRDFISSVLTAIWSVVTSVWNSILTAISAALSAIWAVVSSVWNSVSSTVSSVMSAIWSVISSVWNSILSTISSVLSAVWSTVSSVWNNILSTISSVVSTVWNAVSSAFNNILSVVSSTLASVWSTVSNVWNQVSSYISTVVATVKQVVSDGFNQLKGIVSTAFEAVLGIVRGIPSQIVEALGDLGSLLRDSGAALMRGFGDGITSMIGSIKEKASGAVQAVRDFFPFSPAKTGPFSGRGYVTYSGKALMGDFAKSIQSQEGLLTSSARKALVGVQGSFNAPQLPGANVNRSVSTTYSRGGDMNYYITAPDNSLSPEHFGRRVGEEVAHIINLEGALG